jgi:glucose/arabinose dehydrogenase
MKESIRATTFFTALLISSIVSTARAENISTQAGPMNVEALAQLEHPWGMAYLPGGKLLITEKVGRLRVFADGKLSEPVVGVPDVAFKGQGGLLDVAVDPDFAKNQLVYLSYTEPDEQQPTDAKDEGDHRLGPNFKGEDVTLKGGAVVRGKFDGTKITDLRSIWRQTPKTIGRGHYACRMVFGPDGKLYITSGERQRFEPAQDPNTNLGKIIRVNPDGSIPDDNPFAKKPGHRPELWTMGNRNPLGFAFHPTTGKLWINEMGPKGGDELNLIEAGANYGWPTVCEGVNYDDSPIPKHATRPEFKPPVHQWTPVISPSGMIFYTGSMFPKWKDNAFIGGLSSQAMIRVELDGDKFVADEQIKMNRRIRYVIESPDGAILLLSDGPKGELLRLTPGK